MVRAVREGGDLVKYALVVDSIIISVGNQQVLFEMYAGFTVYLFKCSEKNLVGL